MLSFPRNIYQQQYDVQMRMLAFRLAELAERLALQAGEACPRPVPESWMQLAFAAHQEEVRCSVDVLYRYWSDQEAAAQDQAAPAATSGDV